MVRIPPILASLAALIATPSGASEAVTYQKGPIGDTYKEKVTGKDSWQITAVVGRNKPPSSAAKMALYRASELAMSMGRHYVQIYGLKEKELNNYIGNRSYFMGTKAVVQVRAVPEAAAAGHCPRDVKPNCVTFDAQMAMAEIRPLLIIAEEK